MSLKRALMRFKGKGYVTTTHGVTGLIQTSQSSTILNPSTAKYKLVDDENIILITTNGQSPVFCRINTIELLTYGGKTITVSDLIRSDRPSQEIQRRLTNT